MPEVTFSFITFDMYIFVHSDHTESYFYRTDRGGENVLAADYMLTVRGVDRFSFFAGSSMRNQRCERQWKDTNERCVRPLLFKFK